MAASVPSRPSSRGILRRLRKALAVSAALLFSALLLGMTAQTLLEWRDALRYPPRGRLVAVNGLAVHLNCLGKGSPTVVFDSGVASNSLSFSLVQAEVSKRTRACAFDRPGYAWSEPAATRRDAATVAVELHELLLTAGERPPFVIVGHSLGGYHARVFAAAYRQETAGLVFLDSVHESVAQRLPLMAGVYDFLDKQSRASSWLARAGILYALPSLTGIESDAYRKFPPEDRAVMHSFLSRHADHDAAHAHWLEFVHDGELARAAGGFGRMPLRVVAAGKYPKQEELPRPFPVAEFQRVWMAAQRELVALSSEGGLSVAAGSGHLVPMEEPEAAVRAIGEVLDALAAER